MTTSDIAKLTIAIILDLLDFTVGAVTPGFDIIMGVAALILFGWRGVFAFWEAASPLNPIDGFVPTMTLIALSQIGQKKKDARAEE